MLELFEKHVSIPTPFLFIHAGSYVWEASSSMTSTKYIGSGTAPGVIPGVVTWRPNFVPTKDDTKPAGESGWGKKEDESLQQREERKVANTNDSQAQSPPVESKSESESESSTPQPVLNDSHQVHVRGANTKIGELEHQLKQSRKDTSRSQTRQKRD